MTRDPSDSRPEPATPVADSNTRALPRTLGVLPAVGVMVGVIIGSGIFQTPASVAKLVDSPWLALGCWLLGGVLSFLGALTFAELATMFPQSGGVYVFIREGYGRLMAFVFGWSYMLLIKPFAAAAIAKTLADFLLPLLDRWLNLGLTTPESIASTSLAVTCGMLVGLTAINARGTALGANFATLLTALKAGSLVALVVAAVLAIGSGVARTDRLAESGAEAIGLTPMLGALLAVLWAYDGWSDVGAIAGEVKEPQRNLPRIMLLGTVAVTALYIAVNAAYIIVMPMSEMKTLTGPIATAVAQRLGGETGFVLLSLLIVVSTLGSTHSSILTGARVTFAQSRDGLMFRFLGRVSGRQTPAVALWVQCGMSCFAVLFLGEFNALAGAFVFTMYIFYAMAATAVFILRMRLPRVNRPFRCWGYPVVPALFIVTSLVMVAGEIWSAPGKTLPWLGVFVAGVPVYYIWQHFTNRHGAKV